MPPSASPFRGVAALYASATLFALVSVAVKLAAADFPGLFVSASRFVIGGALCLGVIALRPGRRGAGLAGLLGSARPSDLVLRGVFGALSMASTYAAISLTGPGRATLLSNTYPLFVALFGSLFFGEALAPRTLGSILVATLGALLVVRDGSGAAILGDLLALAGSLLAGFAVNFVRRASRSGCDPFALYLAPCILGLPLILVAPAPPGGFPGSPASLLLLLAVGVGAFLAQALMASGNRTVDAGRGSVVFYWETALTVALGAILAGELLNARFMAGLALIGAGLWINRARSPATGAGPAAGTAA